MRRFSISLAIAKCMRKNILVSLTVVFCAVGAIVFALIPPLVLERVVNAIAEGQAVPFSLALLYFAFLAICGILESSREASLAILGQKITHELRSAMLKKLSKLEIEKLQEEDPGSTTSRFVNDIDAVENLFTSGIISLVADLCRIVSIFVILFIKNRGLAVSLLLLLPLIYALTREFQKRMLKAQISNRASVASISAHIPQTIRTIRTIHNLSCETYMEKKYDSALENSYRAVEKNNFYDSIYSPIIVMINVFLVAAIYMLAAGGADFAGGLFGMSVGTAVAVISYISEVFGPLQSIGMEIQTIQGAVAGIHRIRDFMDSDRKWECDSTVSFDPNCSAVEIHDLDFSYEDDSPVLEKVNLTIRANETVVLSGRTGCGKSTLFKLLLGEYRPRSGSVLIFGQEASRIPDCDKRSTIGYVEQTFHPVLGSVKEQIRLFDMTLTDTQIQESAKLVGLHDAIMALEDGYETTYANSLFSQGQSQLLSIARAIVKNPPLLLLDEITANLDAQTEKTVLRALESASKDRTVIAISHRLYNAGLTRTIELTSKSD